MILNKSMLYTTISEDQVRPITQPDKDGWFRAVRYRWTTSWTWEKVPGVVRLNVQHLKVQP